MIDAPPPKLLLVDDSKTVIYVLRAYLMGQDVQFLQASDGEEGLRLAIRERPSVVISDLEMPNLGGLELCEAIRSAPTLRHTRLVLISSKWTDERRLKATAIGVNMLLHKPVDATALAKLVSGWLQG